MTLLLTSRPADIDRPGVSLHMATPQLATDNRQPTPDETQGERIRRIRTEKGLTQKWVALKANIKPNYLTQIETGYRQPSDEAIRKLAHAMQIAPSLLRVVPLPAQPVTLDMALEDPEALASFVNAPVSDEMLDWCRQMLTIMRDGREQRRLDRQPNA